MCDFAASHSKYYICQRVKGFGNSKLLYLLLCSAVLIISVKTYLYRTNASVVVFCP